MRSHDVLRVGHIALAEALTDRPCSVEAPSPKMRVAAADSADGQHADTHCRGYLSFMYVGGPTGLHAIAPTGALSVRLPARRERLLRKLLRLARRS